MNTVIKTAAGRNACIRANHVRGSINTEEVKGIRVTMGAINRVIV